MDWVLSELTIVILRAYISENSKFSLKSLKLLKWSGLPSEF